MARPAGISMIVESILKKEAERLRDKSEKDGLDELELARLQKLLQLSQLLVNPAKVSEFPDGDLDSIVEEFKPKRAPELFPAKGPKVTSKIHEPES